MCKPAIALFAIVLLAACEDQVHVESPNSYHSDVQAVATQVRGAGDILLVVDGADSVGSPASVEEAVRAAIQGRPGSVNPSYTVDPKRAGQTASTVQVVLNGPKSHDRLRHLPRQRGSEQQGRRNQGSACLLSGRKGPVVDQRPST